MHGKEQTIGSELKKWFNIDLEKAEDIDTDALGTFTGEIPRFGDMLNAARVKALLAIDRTGAQIGLGIEGAFGPHPVVPFLASGLEVILLVDAATGLEVVAQRKTRRNYDSISVRLGDDIASFLKRVGFPEHAVIVRPEGRSDSTGLVKGITELLALRYAIDRACALSDTRSVFIQSDMRAHLNPTRMKTIGFVAKALTVRLARLCPACNTPGFGLTDVLRGLACEECGAPTRRIRAEIHRCLRCGFQGVKRVRPSTIRADARWCDSCNP